MEFSPKTSAIQKSFQKVVCGTAVAKEVKLYCEPTDKLLVLAGWGNLYLIDYDSTTVDVVSIFIKAPKELFEPNPFCDTQVKIKEERFYNTYKIYVKPNKDFFIQYLAYGNEVPVVGRPSGYEIAPTDISDEKSNISKC